LQGSIPYSYCSIKTNNNEKTEKKKIILIK